MPRALLIHPASAGAGGLAVQAEAERDGGLLRLGFLVTGPVRTLRIPSPAAAARRDELWRATCFEAFVQAEGKAGYCEFNLAPSTEWAAYRFDGYRQGMRPLDLAAAPVMSVAIEDALELRAAVVLPRDLAGPVRLGLSAILETRAGEKSYWALAHPPGKPDFHHADCFAARLAAPGAP